MKKFKLIVAAFFIVAMLSGCSSDRKLLTEKLSPQEIEVIQVVLAMGNPEYGADFDNLDKDLYDNISYYHNQGNSTFPLLF